MSLGNQTTHCLLEEAQEDEQRLSVRASLFFDGTLNNLHNTISGIQRRKEGESTKDSSYGNDFSNVERLRRN